MVSPSLDRFRHNPVKTLNVNLLLQHMNVDFIFGTFLRKKLDVHNQKH